jgi:hypothetical protein
MEAKELKNTEVRVSNLVQNASGGYQFEVTPEMILEPYGLYPIPLTEEWLLKFGAKDNLPWELENLRLDCEDRLSIVDDTGYGIIIARDVKYVHRLQNIYEDLKQRPLEITKTK